MNKKAKEEFIAKNKGNDKIRGRLIRLNRQKLEVRKGKNYAEILFFGDIHLGYPTCDIERAKKMIQYAIDKRIYLMLMGDLVEAGLKDSIGDSMYRQTLNPDAQMWEMIDILTPVAKAGLILGMHEGNHEARITKSTSIDITKIMAKILKVPYLSHSCWSLLSVDGVRYSLYSTHGTSAATMEYTQMNAVIKLAKIVLADITAYGHTHGLGSKKIITQMFSPKENRIIKKKQYVCLTGAYMEWDKSYAQMKGYTIADIGSPKAILRSDKHKVNFSL